MSLVITNLGYRYPTAAKWTFQELNLTARAGEKLVVTGNTGSGKSTLLRLVVGSLQRHGQGDMSGQVTIDGRDILAMRPAERARAVSRVAQRPKEQVLSQRVDEELAFGMASVGQTSVLQKSNIHRLLEAVDLDVDPSRNPNTLSGGQLQRLMMGCGLATESKVLCLDEPLAHLDASGVEQLLAVLHLLSLKGITIVVVEHRLASCLEWADRVFELRDQRLFEVLDPKVEGITVPERKIISQPPSREPAVAWSHDSISWRYGKGPMIFEDQSLQFHTGEWMALIGANGVGKSTLLQFIQENPQGKKLLILPQDASLCLFSDTVYDELSYGPTEWDMDNVDGWVHLVASSLGLLDLLEQAPLSLSAGQQLRVALGSILACKPDIIGLDEPTVGQDREHVVRILDAIADLAPDSTVIVSTHDDRLLNGVMDRHVQIADGRITSILPPRTKR